MRRRRTILTAVLGAVALTTLAPAARAFCGFYVSGADNKLFADATQVVLMREGQRTVLSMQNDYKGPPDRFALVIPVPVVLQKENVKVLPREIFDKVDKLGAPRLVEYWEQDPCPTGIGDGFGLGGLGLSGIGAGGGGRGEGIGLGNLGVKVEAKFAVGEYEIVILSAENAAGLETWLKQEKYAIPEGAAPYFKPYITGGSRFFVAKVDPTKLKFEDGRAQLSPLRFHYDTDTFKLPVRLGLINSSGKQDLIVNILARQTRYEAANYPNAFIPTNLDVAEAARGKFGEFYAALFDKVLEKAPKTVVTEYSWDAGTCDPCPGPTLDGNDAATLGADVLPNGTDGLTGSGGGLGTIGGGGGSKSGLRGAVRVEPPTVSDKRLPAEVVQRIVRQNAGRFRFCYENGLKQNPKLAGKLTVRFGIERGGAVSSAADGGGDLADAAVKECVTKAFSNLAFPQPEGGATQITVPLVFAVDNSPPPVFSGFGGVSMPYVLTRLHLRYDKDTLGDDIVFKAAPAVSGGREIRSLEAGTPPISTLERGAKPAPTNNFQGRYAIRHPWTGPILCKEPRRGVWGGRPPDVDAGPATSTPSQPIAAQKTAFVARGASLASFITGPLPDLGVQPAIPATDPSAAPSVSAAPAASATTPPAPPPRKGCAAGGAGAGDLASALGLAGMIAWIRHRKRPR